MGWPIHEDELAALDNLRQSKMLIILDQLDPVEPSRRQEIAGFLSRWDIGLGGRALLTMRDNLPEFHSIVRDAVINVESIDEAAAVELLVIVSRRPK